MLLLLLSNIDHIVAGVNSVSVVIERHLTRFARNVARLQVLKQTLACQVQIRNGQV